MISWRFQFAWISVLVIVMVGCGPSGPKTHSVSGKVTIKGQAATDVSVTFEPLDSGGQTASGRVGADGSYTLLTGVQGKPGAMAGKYKVVLSGGAPQQSDPAAIMAQAAAGKGRSAAAEGPIPKEYQSAATSPKEVEVKPGANTINIDI